MAKSTAAPKSANLATVLDLATNQTKTEMGTDPVNKSVKTDVSMTTAVTEDASTTSTTVTAGVSLGTSTKTEAVPAPATAK
jgi:hypothetical protein